MPLECSLESFPNIARVLKSQLYYRYHISCLILGFRFSQKGQSCTASEYVCSSIHVQKYMSILLSVIRKYTLIYILITGICVCLFMPGSMQSATDKYTLILTTALPIGLYIVSLFTLQSEIEDLQWSNYMYILDLFSTESEAELTVARLRNPLFSVQCFPFRHIAIS